MLTNALSVRCTANEAASGHIVEARHLHLRNDETVLVDRVNNLASVHVGVRLDHSELCLLSTGETFARGSIGVVLNLQLSAVNSNNGTNEQS